jgi:hypothetical protein
VNAGACNVITGGSGSGISAGADRTDTAPPAVTIIKKQKYLTAPR